MDTSLMFQGANSDKIKKKEVCVGAVSNFIASNSHYLSLKCTKHAPIIPPTSISLCILPATSWLSQVISYHVSLLTFKNAELNPICHLLALLGAHHIFHVSGIRFNDLF